MSEKVKSKTNNKENSPEKVSRFLRNINILGAFAVGGVAVLIPGPNVILAGWAALNVAQAGGFELARRAAKNRKTISGLKRR